MATPRRRSARALVNDEKIRRAVIDEIVAVGVDNLSLRDVGRRAGLTHGATYARFEDVDEMIIDTWDAVLRHQVLALYRACQLAAYASSPADFESVFVSLRNPPPEQIAGLHVFLSARRNLVVREVVRAFTNEHLRYVDPVSGSFRPRDLDALLVFALVIARLLSRHHQLEDARLTAISLDFAANMIAAHTENVARQNIPPVIIPRSRLHDPVRQALHEAAFIVVGRSGVDHATLSRIDRLALCEVGTAHDLYATRDELIADAYRHSYTDYWMRLNNFVNVLEPGYLATLFEAAINEADPDRRVFIIEFTLALGHHDVLAGAAKELVAELESITDELDAITPDEVVLLQAMIRILSYAMVGISMIEALCGSLTWEQLVALGDSIRLGILATHEETWASLRDKLHRYYLTQVP